MIKKIFLGLAATSLLLAAFFTTATYAASCEGVSTAIIDCDSDGKNQSGIGHVLDLIINILSIGVGILGVIGISVVGVQYLTAGGNEEKIRKAKRRLFEIVIGLVAYALAAALLQWLLPGGSLNPSDIPSYEAPEKPQTSGGGQSGGSSGGGQSGGGSGGGTTTPKKTYDRKEMELVKLNNGKFDYILDIPNNATEGMPLVVVLHGRGDRWVSESGLKDLLKSLGVVEQSRKYITIAPKLQRNESEYNQWIGLTGEVQKLIDDVKKTYNIDKVYIVGYSDGAEATWKLVNENPNFFAGAAPISAPPRSNEQNNTGNFQKTKICAAVGEAETNNFGLGLNYVSSMGNFVDKIKQAGGSATLYTISRANHENVYTKIKDSGVYNCLGL